MSTYNEVVHLNNAAVHEFESGRLDDARIHFQEAVQAAYAMLASCSSNSAEYNETQNASLAERSASVHGGWSTTPLTAEYRRRKQVDEIFIFARTIRLTSGELDPPSPNRYVSFIAFNLAVTVHIIATVHSSLPLHFEAASRLYDMSLRRTEQDKWMPTETQSLMRISTLNNIGAIFHSELMRYGDAKECFQTMHELLIAHQANARSGTFNKMELFELTMNLYVQNLNSATAA